MKQKKNEDLKLTFGSSIFKIGNNSPLSSNQDSYSNNLFNFGNQVDNNKGKEKENNIKTKIFPNYSQNNKPLFSFNITNEKETNINKENQQAKPLFLRDQENNNNNRSLFSQNKKEIKKDEKKIFLEDYFHKKLKRKQNYLKK